MLSPSAFRERLVRRGEEVEAFLGEYTTGSDAPQGLMRAVAYSLMAGGKRLRPVLCLEAAGLFGCGEAMPFAAAIECIHSYSLIHDDLPAMDNDDMRRGKPSNHKAFGEATAILAGDALLTDAFALMASCALPADRLVAAMARMARAAGSPGMVGGQYLDMQMTGGSETALDSLKAMHAGKTGALIAASCACGAILAGASASDVEQLDQYGRCLGSAFQIVDDILDVVGDEKVLGKPVGSDQAEGKITYPSLVGLDASREMARQETDAAMAALADYGPEADFLRALAEHTLERAS